MQPTLHDIPVIEAASRLGRRPPASSPLIGVFEGRGAGRSPADALAGTFPISAGLELAEALRRRAFPSGSLLATMHGGGTPSYSTYYDCTVYNYAGTCDEACFGFAPHHMDPFYCATCDEQAADPAHNPSYNWHFWGSRGSIQYMDREPDVCNGRDAWKWKVGACGECEESAVFRCHDGYKKYPDSGTWDPTICQGLVSCDGELTLC